MLVATCHEYKPIKPDLNFSRLYGIYSENYQYVALFLCENNRIEAVIFKDAPTGEKYLNDGFKWMGTKKALIGVWKLKTINMEVDCKKNDIGSYDFYLRIK